MARITPWLIVVLLIVLGFGCATSRQPVMSEAQISPPELKPEESALLAVKIKDKYGIVKKVEGVVREDPRIKLELHDDGKNGDKKAGDGIWSLRVDVPFHAAPGQFTVDITAYNSKGDPVVVRNKEGDVTPLATTCKVTIQPATQ